MSIELMCVYRNECCGGTPGLIVSAYREESDHYVLEGGRKVCKECYEPLTEVEIWQHTK